VKPIQGVRVLDLSRMVAGGDAGMLLADFGAEVVEVEQPAVAVQTIADIERDPHWRERQLTVDVPADGATVRMHNVVPPFSQTPGAIEWAGGALGRDNDAFYRTELGLTCDDVQRLSADAII
jgi:crotonobetainyl-CoA:carnitine CoA-transferase CaiB-like acyl-CoA transferase